MVLHRHFLCCILSYSLASCSRRVCHTSTQEIISLGEKIAGAKKTLQPGLPLWGTAGGQQEILKINGKGRNVALWEDHLWTQQTSLCMLCSNSGLPSSMTSLADQNDRWASYAGPGAWNGNLWDPLLLLYRGVRPTAYCDFQLPLFLTMQCLKQMQDQHVDGAACYMHEKSHWTVVHFLNWYTCSF